MRRDRTRGHAAEVAHPAAPVARGVAVEGFAPEPGTWHAELTLPAPAQNVELYLSRAATVGFVLYGA